MAIEYNFEVSPMLKAEEVLKYCADLLGCDEYSQGLEQPTHAFREEVGLTTIVLNRDESDIAKLFRVDQIVSATFRVKKFHTREEYDTIFRDVIAACAKFLEDHPGSKGILSFQGEQIYLQRLGDDRIVLSERLRDPDFNHEGVLDQLLAKYQTSELGMVDDLPGIGDTESATSI
ncbi:hypothetical protein K4F52_007930 [Lecanicillium sp. MT-2017a]|nr:hypothetical protein K4F52_007930 [Lecanicillium sp. MT-2017a]